VFDTNIGGWQGMCWLYELLCQLYRTICDCEAPCVFMCPKFEDLSKTYLAWHGINTQFACTGCKCCSDTPSLFAMASTLLHQCDSVESLQSVNMWIRVASMGLLLCPEPRSWWRPWPVRTLFLPLHYRVRCGNLCTCVAAQTSHTLAAQGC
jgi:hypothetical protein